MKHTGIILFLLGCGGISEAYGKPTQIIISLILMIIGCLILFTEVRNEKVHIDRSNSSSNILDRLQFLP